MAPRGSVIAVVAGAASSPLPERADCDIQSRPRKSTVPPVGPSKRQADLGERVSLVEDADGEESCVQIDAAVELVWFGVEAHHGLLGLGGA